jgi:hypothetical protein
MNDRHRSLFATLASSSSDSRQYWACELEIGLVEEPPRLSSGMPNSATFLDITKNKGRLVKLTKKKKLRET